MTERLGWTSYEDGFGVSEVCRHVLVKSFRRTSCCNPRDMHGINTISVNNDGCLDDRSSIAYLIDEPARTNPENSPPNRTHAVSGTRSTQNGVCDTTERRHVHQLVWRAVSRPWGLLGVRWCRASERYSAQRHLLPNVSNAFGAFGVGSPMATCLDSLYAHRRSMLPKKICAGA